MNGRNESTRVLVIGGGLAGMAAASALAEHGMHVILLEARNQLGGRASSFKDASADQVVDNCQHVSMGCCTNLKDFCRRVGTDVLLSQQRWLYFQDESGRVSRFGGWPLPCPLHLAPAFVTAQFLSLGDKLRIAYGMLQLLRQPRFDAQRSFLDWLLENGQTQQTCDRFWGVILVSALNETLENIDYRYARQVFVEGFLWNKESSVVEIPRVSLSEFYGEAVLKWFAARNVDVRLLAGVRRLHVADEMVRTCELRTGETLTADEYVLATPFHRTADLLPETVATNDSVFKNLSRLGSSPITSVHLWFDRPVMQLPHLVPVGRQVQWLFVRSTGTDGNGPGQYVQAVISASGSLAERGNDEVFRIVLDEVKQILPEAAGAMLQHYRVVTERSATYSVAPGVDEFRPDQQTPIENLWLAGDYTRTDWPATMEGAVRSGYLAAEKILAKHGRDVSLIQPPLSMCPLTRLLLRR